MDLVLATNFDDQLPAEARDLPVKTYFGGFPYSLTGAGRPPHILPAITPERFREHLERIHEGGRVFYATVNSTDLGLKEYQEGFRARFLQEVGRLLELGTDGFVVALPLLVEIIHREYPDVPISVSTFSRLRTVAQGEYFLRMGARTLVLEEANRDLRLIRGLVRAGAEVEILVNQTCIHDCPYRAHHLNTSSLVSQDGTPGIPFEVPILECGLQMLKDPTLLVSSIWVRPEDLSLYEAAGVHRFKVSGRNRSTPWLLRSARAYSQRRYDGNLLDILSYVQVKGPLQALGSLSPTALSDPEIASVRDAFERMQHVSIDNSAFPPDFLRRVLATDCAHLSCKECGYCGSVAQKVVRIDGRPLSEYRPPAPSLQAESLLRHLRPEASAAAVPPTVS
jgi:collagenase-like PrtC family protease